MEFYVFVPVPDFGKHAAPLQLDLIAVLLAPCTTPFPESHLLIGIRFCRASSLNIASDPLFGPFFRDSTLPSRFLLKL